MACQGEWKIPRYQPWLIVSEQDLHNQTILPALNVTFLLRWWWAKDKVDCHSESVCLSVCLSQTRMVLIYGRKTNDHVQVTFALTVLDALLVGRYLRVLAGVFR